MSLDIAVTFAILGIAIVLFVTEILRADLVGLLVLVALVVLGLVSPEEGIAGFANPAVVTIWAVFILSEGLARTGVASALGNQVLRLAGKGEGRLLAVLMSSTSGLSAIMNNVGVAAMFLPVTMDIARRTKTAASRLLLPMAYGSLLGGMLTLIGTSSNLVVSDFLREAGLQPLGLFDFTPIGVVITAAAIGYMLLIGRRLLPERHTPQPLSAANGSDLQPKLRQFYGLEERLAALVIPDGSPLIGKTLLESRFGRALGLNVLSVERRSGRRHPPERDLVLEAGDRLLVLGRLDVIDELAARPTLAVEEDLPTASRLLSEDIGFAELDVTAESMFAGRTVVGMNARHTLGVNVLAVRRGEKVRRTNLDDFVFEPGDRLLLQGAPDRLEGLRDHHGYRRLSASEADRYHLEERLRFVRIPAGSSLVGRTLKDARLGGAFGIAVLGVMREGERSRMPEPHLELRAGDLLIVGGRPTDLEVLRGLQGLLIERDTSSDLQELEDGPLALVEVMLSPSTTLAGKTLRQLRFRERYGVSVLAVWRGERPYRTGLGDHPLQFGDALLCYGPHEKFKLLAMDRDLVVLSAEVQERPRLQKAPLAAVIMAAVVGAVVAGWLPISIAAIAGASLMVLTGCLSMDEAYRAIEWRAVFLIATMLPMGAAMLETGAAALLAGAVVEAVGPWGPTAILAGITALTLIVNQFIPSAANAVVMTPIALATAAGLGVSPYPFVMGIAYAAAASFMTPVSHPANVLVMSPGGYRFTDYILNGLPLSLIVLAASVALLPLVFPY